MEFLKEKLRKKKKINSLKGYLTGILANLDKNKIETNLGTLRLRKSVSVAIDNLELIPKKYIQKKVELIADKRILSELLKHIKGVHLEDKYSLQIRWVLKSILRSLNEILIFYSNEIKCIVEKYSITITKWWSFLGRDKIP